MSMRTILGGLSNRPHATRDAILPRDYFTTDRVDPEDLISHREVIVFGLGAFACPFIIAGICLILISWFG